MKFKYYKSLITALSLIALCTGILTNSPVSAFAFSFQETIPVYGLYCASGNTVLSGEVGYDLTDADLLFNGKANVKAEYKICDLEGETNFTIPFVSSFIGLPPPVVYVNGQEVNGEINYGKYDYSYYKENEIMAAINETYPSKLNESQTGTLYTVTPAKNELTVSINKLKNQSIIYDTSIRHTSLICGEQTTFTFYDVTPEDKFSFYILGQCTNESFSSNCEFEQEIITCKEYADKYYGHFKEFYEINGNPNKEYFYSQLNALMHDGRIVAVEEIFLNSYTEYKINTLNFKVAKQSNAAIEVHTQAGIGYDGNYSPYVFDIKFKNASNYSVKLNVKLNENFAYTLDCNLPLTRDGNDCSAQTYGDFHLKFCSVQTPVNTYAKRQKEIAKYNKIRIAVITVSAVIAAAAIIVIVIILLKYFKRKI